MDMVSDFHISRAGMYWSIKHLVALSIQKETKDAKETEHFAYDLDRYAPHDWFSVVNFCHSTENRCGARRRHFLLPMFCTRIVK